MRTAFDGLAPDTRSAALTVRSSGRGAEVSVAASPLRRARGLFFSDADALIIVPCNSVHSIGLTRHLEVAYLDRAGTVLRIRELPPHRMHAPVRGARAVLEASPGRFDEWGLREGDTVTVEPL